jgi:hypothetical protein
MQTLKDNLYTILGSISGSENVAVGTDQLSGKKRGRTPGSSASTAPAVNAAYRGVKPIIIVPAASTSLITKVNAISFLQDGHFVSPTEARDAHAVAPTDVVIRRTDERGNQMQFRVIDDVSALKTYDDWWDYAPRRLVTSQRLYTILLCRARVVAVFANGPEWQFKGWKWGRPAGRPDITPSEFFNRCLSRFRAESPPASCSSQILLQVSERT